VRGLEMGESGQRMSGKRMRQMKIITPARAVTVSGPLRDVGFLPLRNVFDCESSFINKYRISTLSPVQNIIASNRE
jgi:hypothetical protein